MRLIGHCATTNTQILSSSIFIYMCVTFMSFTMAWNNPPSAPHSFSTDSMVSKKTKQKKIAERQGSDEISDSWSVFKHQKRRSGFCSSGLSCPLVTTTLSQQRRGCEASEPTASSLQSAQTKRNVLFDGTGSCCSPRRRRYSPLGRTGGMEQGRALAGRTTAGKRGGHMHRGSSWSPR